MNKGKYPPDGMTTRGLAERLTPSGTGQAYWAMNYPGKLGSRFVVDNFCCYWPLKAENIYRPVLSAFDLTRGRFCPRTGVSGYDEV